MNRRKFLKNSLLTVGSIMSVATLSIIPKRVFASWPKSSFDEKDLEKSIKSVYGHSDLTESSKVILKAPEIAENGAIVPINVKTKLKRVESIMVFVENNPQPLSSGYYLSSLAEPTIGTRIKMGKSSKVIAAVKSGNKVYSSSKEIKITIGGCGG
ncbi:MAG: thiosulfate oxidation carrier protein SoxY [Gammaproteobacteria bacterium]|nr:thiosulfate oxidation carrier protein SoxY [Gammaproteobacteria bacterium]|tara:strand:- start:70258 stop:70722 length:465 start_codon:yes stop_codon:yes gene_type:complete